MDLFSPCRSCLQCLPFFHVSPPSSPRPASATPEPSSGSPQEATSLVSAAPDASEYAQEVQTSTPAALHATPAEQDLTTSVKVVEEEEVLNTSYAISAEIGSGIQSSIISEDEALPVSDQIVVAPPVSSPSSYTETATKDDAETTKATVPPELPLHVPFINDISFPSSGLMHLPSPTTPALFGTGYNHSTGQYHPTPQIYPDAHDIKEQSSQGHSSPQFEHVSSHGHDHSHHAHEHGHSHGHWHDGHDSSHHSHAHAAPLNIDALSTDTSEVDVPSVVDAETNDAILQLSSSTLGYPGVEAKSDGQNGSSNGEQPVLIEAYHSEPIVLSGIPDDVGDGSGLHEEDISHNASLPGHRHRRRDHFKDQFKGIRQQIKEGGHHLKEEGSKHLQSFMDNVNKQAQQIEQSGSFFIVPRGVNN